MAGGEEAEAVSVLGLSWGGTSLPRVTCFDCGDRVEHCHGTLIRHTRDVAECTDVECTVPEVACHALAIDCVELACVWCGPTRVRRAA
jgi:hypothetical protein